MPLEKGALLKRRYRIEGILGQGGMGAVYHAIDINLGVRVAVKENLFVTEEYARQFHREATILASLRHPNLTRVTDHFVLKNQGQYLVMDYIEGQDLRLRVKKSGPVSEKEAVPWLLEICDALCYLHSCKPLILHRDIKPGNIKITPEGHAYLVDFGLAKVVGESGQTTVGAKAMTPGFSPPEQYGTGHTDVRSDIYSLAATMYAVLGAALPEEALERAMGRKALTPLRKRNSTISPGIEKIIEKALQVRPDDRFQNVNEFASAVRAAATVGNATVIGNFPYLDLDQPTRVNVSEDKADKKPAIVGKLRQRLPVIAIAALVIVLIAAAFSLPGTGSKLAAFFSSATQPATSSGPSGGDIEGTATSLPGGQGSNTPIATPLGTEDQISAGPAATLTASKAGTEVQPTPNGGGAGQIAFASNRNGTPQIYLMNIDGTDIYQLTDLTDGACQPAWSPDGTRLVFTSPCSRSKETYPGSSLWIIGADGENMISLPTAPGGGDFDAVWSPDGKRLAFTSMRDGHPQLYVINIDGSGLLNLSKRYAAEGQPAWDPAGDQLVFVSERSNNSVLWFISDSTGDEVRFSRPDGLDDTHPNWSKDQRVIIFERQIGGIPRLLVKFYDDGGRAARKVCPSSALGGYPMAEPKWSPDGRWIAFETWPEGNNHEIAIMMENCMFFTIITNGNPAFDFDPAWHP